ncbi:hypothetical protein QBD00_002194 [Ochrobactrum sp. AN78]|nr:hypothetical protein [Ochrobactrum sp. AN78]
MLLAHHVNEFDASERDAGCSFGLEAEHEYYPAFDASMVLLNRVIQIFAGADHDGVARAFQPVSSTALQDGNAVGLATFNGDPLWSAVAGQSLAQEAFGGGQVASSTEVELNRIAIAINGALQIQPFTFDLHMGRV